MGTFLSASRPRPLFWIGLVAIVALGVESGAYVVELLSARAFDEPIRRRSTILREQTSRIALLIDSTPRREVLDPLLGWRYRAGYASPLDHLSAQGLRSRRHYGAVPAPGTLRIAAFGDSFVYGNEVSDDDAWCAVLEAGSDAVEVLNYGVGGYGLDQAFLRYQSEGMALHPDVVLIGFTPDDLGRIVNVYRRFISSRELPLAKPRFVLIGDSLELVPNPLPRRQDYRNLMLNPAAVRALGKADDWYSRTIYEHPLYDALATLRVGHALWQRLQRRALDPNRLVRRGVFNERSMAFQLQVALLRAFAEAARQRNAVPVVILLPDRGSVAGVRRGAAAVYAPLEAALLKAGINVWDAADAFRSTSCTVDELFAPGGHYSPRGNRVVAEWLRGILAPDGHPTAPGAGPGRRSPRLPA